MMLLKGCQRCSGDLLGSEDMYGSYHQCIQCGALYDLPDACVKVVAAKTPEPVAKRAQKKEVAA